MIICFILLLHRSFRAASRLKHDKGIDPFMKALGSGFFTELRIECTLNMVQYIVVDADYPSANYRIQNIS